MTFPRSSSFVTTLGLVFVVSAWTQAAELPLPANQPPVYLLLFDLRLTEPGEVTNTTEGGGPVAFPISAIDGASVTCDTLAPKAPLHQLKAYVECAVGHRLSGADFDDTDKDPSNDSPDVTARRRAAAAIADNLAELRKSTSTRAISTRGSNIVAVSLQTAVVRTLTRNETQRCLNPATEPARQTEQTYRFVFGRKPQFTIAEVARKSQLETDFNVLVTLAGKIIQAPPPPPSERCLQREKPVTIYTSRTDAATWSLATAIPLVVKRATVTLDATLPAVAPQLVAAELVSNERDGKENANPIGAGEAQAILKLADEFLRQQALRNQETEDLKLFDMCPPVDPGRLESLQQVVCALGPKPTPNTSPLAAVEALTKLTTPRRVTFLRWAVENKTGDVRDNALVALAQIAPAAPAQAAAPKEVKQTSKFLSGPLEHWSISADVFTSRKTPFKKDASGTVVLDGKPPVFYVSLNFLLGDLPSTERKLWENIELKWLVKGSKSPFDSVGFGVGLRGSYAKRFGFDFDLLSPFVGWTWTEAEDSSEHRVLETRFGVSMNINKALDWVK